MTGSSKRDSALHVITAPVGALSDASWLYPFKERHLLLLRPSIPMATPSRPASPKRSTLTLRSHEPFPMDISSPGQVALLAIFHGRLAWLNATFLVLGEGAAIVSLLFEAFFVDETLVDVFDAVLIKEGYTDLIASSRILDPDGRDPVKQLGKPTMSAVYSPFSFRQIAEFIIFLPLNFIPVAGTPMFLILTGYRAGPLQQWRYFKLLEFTKKERNAFIKKRRLRYTWFGTVALLLQLVPVLSMLFLLTTAAGSALWVAKLEGKRRALEATPQDDSSERYADNAS